jgi:hypothetical protein
MHKFDVDAVPHVLVSQKMIQKTYW